MLTRDLFAVANLPVQFPSVNMHLRIINIIAIMQYNTHSSRVTKFVYGWSSTQDHAGELTSHNVPQTPYSAGDGDTLPHCSPVNAFGVSFRAPQF